MLITPSFKKNLIVEQFHLHTLHCSALNESDLGRVFFCLHILRGYQAVVFFELELDGVWLYSPVPLAIQ